MTKKESFRKAIRSYVQMVKFLKRVIGARSRSTIMGLDKSDPGNLHAMDMKMLYNRRKARGNKVLSGKPKCVRVKQ